MSSNSVIQGVYTLGMARAHVKIGLVTLAYNFTRLTWLNKQSKLHPPKGATCQPRKLNTSAPAKPPLH
jgi:cytochrome b561